VTVKKRTLSIGSLGVNHKLTTEFWIDLQPKTEGFATELRQRIMAHNTPDGSFWRIANAVEVGVRRLHDGYGASIMISYVYFDGVNPDKVDEELQGIIKVLLDDIENAQLQRDLLSLVE